MKFSFEFPEVALADASDDVLQGQGADRVCDDDHKFATAPDGRRLCHQLDRPQL